MRSRVYSVKEIYYTLQGEGAQAGRAAVFCRFTGCNLWTGREEDRASAVCTFCDTDFVGSNGPGGGRFASAESLADAVVRAWKPSPEGSGKSGVRPLVVCTGGEPLLQLDRELVAEFASRGFQVAVETNGTQAVPPGVDWVCVSPKASAQVVVAKGNELKLVFPQAKAMPFKFEHLDFEHFFLQPMDGVRQKENINSAVQFCLDNPKWRLSIQTHKVTGIP